MEGPGQILECEAILVGKVPRIESSAEIFQIRISTSKKEARGGNKEGAKPQTNADGNGSRKHSISPGDRCEGKLGGKKTGLKKASQCK